MQTTRRTCNDDGPQISSPVKSHNITIRRGWLYGEPISCQMGANRQLERRKNLPVGGARFVPIIQLRRVRKFVKWVKRVKRRPASTRHSLQAQRRQDSNVIVLTPSNPNPIISKIRYNDFAS